ERELAAALRRGVLARELALELGDPRADRVAVARVVVGDDLGAADERGDLEVGVGDERLARVVEPGERGPAALRIARVDVGSAVLVDLDADEAFLEEALDARVGEHATLEVGAPTTPTRADEEEDGDTALPGRGERRIAPLEPALHGRQPRTARKRIEAATSR